jgi:hypothetical protein
MGQADAEQACPGENSKGFILPATPCSKPLIMRLFTIGDGKTGGLFKSAVESLPKECSHPHM